MIRQPFYLAWFASVLAALVVADDGWAQSWPTYRHDNRRSGVTDATLDFPLSVDWIWKSPQLPQTAWSGPAKWDAYSGNAGLQSMRNFDPCFYVTADETAVYFGSSVDDAVHALDSETGQERWVHYTGAAVRFPPTLALSRLLFGSDDGAVYCCGKESGDLIWRQRAAASNQRITSNRKIISLWPVRTGVLVDGNLATFAGSLVPWEKSVLVTLRVENGKSEGEGCFRRELTGVTMQGAMLASENLLYAPQGRAAPLAFDRTDGAPRGTIGEAGGVFCVLSEDEMLFAGPPDQRESDEQIRIARIGSKSAIASFSGTNRILVDGHHAWLSINEKLKMLDQQSYVRAQQLLARATAELDIAGKPRAPLRAAIDRARQIQQSAWKWSVDSPNPLDMIKAGDAIVCGFAGEVRAYSVMDGRELWRSEIEGDAHGLAVAAGRLFVSTDRGHIYAFGASP